MTISVHARIIICFASLLRDALPCSYIKVIREYSLDILTLVSY